MIDPRSSVGDVATRHPLATRVFARHQIDFCCGGARPLAEACAARGVDPGVVIREIEAELASGPSGVRWDEQPLSALIEHILEVYHAPLAEELPRLLAMAEKVHRVHRDKAPEQLDAVLETCRAIKDDLEQHLPKEERVLFPMILQGHGPRALAPMRAMESEHDALGHLLERLRALTDGFTPPAEACNTWRALWAGLEALERATHEHIHLENNVLHPRARQG